MSNFKLNSRYDVSLTPEGQFQPNSNNQVLLNKLGIADLHEMENIELDLLDKLTDVVVHSIA